MWKMIKAQLRAAVLAVALMKLLHVGITVAHDVVADLVAHYAVKAVATLADVAD